MDGAKSYEVRLYRNDKLLTTIRTSNEYYNFSGKIERTGYYSFRVRAIAEYNGKAGEWSDYSYESYFGSDEVHNQSVSASGHWVQNKNRWWYSYNNGAYPKACWKFIDNVWYYFNWNGYMVTGWQYIDNNWYYLLPNGAMAIGWQYVNDRWYYLDSSGAMLTGLQFINSQWYFLNSSGVMLTDWQFINDKWYYLDSSGAMYSNTITPDGHYVDSSGVMVN